LPPLFHYIYGGSFTVMSDRYGHHACMIDQHFNHTYMVLFLHILTFTWFILPCTHFRVSQLVHYRTPRTLKKYWLNKMLCNCFVQPYWPTLLLNYYGFIRRTSVDLFKFKIIKINKNWWSIMYVLVSTILRCPHC
jgi:hypothetical protein